MDGEMEAELEAAASAPYAVVMDEGLEMFSPEWEQRRMDRRQAARERQAARTELAGTDYRVVRAMERMLIEQGHLPSDFGTERDAMRDRAKGSPAA